MDEPGPGEITVQVKASGVNFPDTLCLTGLYPTPPDYPYVPGFEVAGVVTKVGRGVTSHAPGDAVVALTGAALGGHAAYVNVSEAHAVRIPRGVSFEDAASLPVAYTTAHYALELAALKPGERVLVHTATGGCGSGAARR